MDAVSFYKEAKKLSVKDSVLLNTQDYLQTRAARASKEKFLKALDKVPDVEPVKGDEI